MNNQEIEKEFKQVCVAPALIVGTLGKQHRSFEEFMLAMFHVRVKYIEEITTNPDVNGDGVDIPDTGFRNDTFFYIHEDDIGKFALPRLEHNIRWVEDIFFNHQEYLYPTRIKKYMTWNPFSDDYED
jgi:hypothetical protein